MYFTQDKITEIFYLTDEFINTDILEIKALLFFSITHF